MVNRRTSTIVIESVGKILFWQKKNTNSNLKRHLAPYTEGLYKRKNEINKIYLFLMYHFFLIFATMNINMSANHVFNLMPKLINNVRATVYRMAIPLDSKVAI